VSSPSPYFVTYVDAIPVMSDQSSFYTSHVRFTMCP
jgi:hypothetical protein